MRGERSGACAMASLRCTVAPRPRSRAEARARSRCRWRHSSLLRNHCQARAQAVAKEPAGCHNSPSPVGPPPREGEGGGLERRPSRAPEGAARMKSRFLLPAGCALAALVAGSLAAMAGEEMTERARKFVREYERKLRPLEVAAAAASWDANVTGKKEDFKRKEETQNRID